METYPASLHVVSLRKALDGIPLALRGSPMAVARIEPGSYSSIVPSVQSWVARFLAIVVQK